MNYFNPLPTSPLSTLSGTYPNLLAALAAVPATPLPPVSLQWIAVRQRFTKEALDKEILVFFEHDPAIAAGYIRDEGGKRRVLPALG